MRKTYKLMPVYALLSLGAVFMVFPFVWMVLTSLKTGADVYSFSMIPNPATTQNYSFVFTRTDFVRWFMNSIFIAVMVVSSVLLFDTLVGYTLCKMQFKGKQLVNFFTFGGQHNNGHVSSCLLVSHSSADLVAILAGQH